VLTALTLAAALQSAMPPLGVLTYEEARDPISDKAVAEVLLGSRDGAIGLVCPIGGKGGIKVLFVTERYLRSTGWLTAANPLTYRFDSDPPVTTDWYYDEHQAYIFSRKQVTAFAKRLLTARTLYVRAKNYAHEDVDSAFKIDAAEPALRRFMRTCNDAQMTKELFGAAH
jgi:hypothetical protein